MIRRQWIDARLDICEVLLQKDGHIRVKAAAIRYGQVGMGTRPGGFTSAPVRTARKPAHGQAVPDIPGNAWQLRCSVSGARDETGQKASSSIP